MKKNKLGVIRITSVIVLIGTVLWLGGCSNNDLTSCEGTELPAAWSAAGFSPIEGGTVCAYNHGKSAIITYKGIEWLELHDKYADKVKNEGWTFVKDSPDRTFFWVSKNGKGFTYSFTDCSKLFSKCSRVDITGP